MPKPTATAIRSIIEGYGVSSDVITNEWLIDCMNEEILPHIEDLTGLTFDGLKTKTEFFNGNGTSTLILNKKNIVSVVNVRDIGSINSFPPGSVELISEEGILKAKTSVAENRFSPVFRKGEKSIEVTFTYDLNDCPGRVARAIKLLVAARALQQIGARTGGGSLSADSFSRNYGASGKYGDFIKPCVTMAYGLLKKYMPTVVGG